ncbi:MAG: hypothetical protein RLY16_1744 [Bacteroidota bacterium]
MKKYFLTLVTLLFLATGVKSQCPPNAFAFTSTYPQCPDGCGVLLKDWPEGVVVNIYGGTPLVIITSVLIPGTYGGPGTGNAFSCVPCNVPLVFASTNPNASSGCVIIYLGTVAIDITSFSVTNTGNQPQLKWTAANDSRGDVYTVQKSTLNGQFVDIAALPAIGGTNKTYNYTDATLNAGNVQYRLKMTDIAGTVTYSQTVTVKAKTSFGISIYPNPTQQGFHVAVPTALLPASIQLINAQGQIVAKQNTTVANNEFTQSLPAGIYAVRVTGSNNEIITQTLIKK